MSQPLPSAPLDITPQAAPKSTPKATPKAAPRVAFDPLDPQWRNGARDTSKAASAAPSAPGQATRSAPLDAQGQRRQEQADALVAQARRAVVRGDARGAREQLKQAFAVDAASASGLELLGDIFLAEAEQEKALQVFKRGLELHPEHAAFEEKIGLALLDIDEEKRDREITQLLLENPGSLRWAERKPTLAASLSLLVPGAGQAYNDQPERGALFCAGAVLCFGGWYWLLSSATSNLTGRQILGRSGEAVAQMGMLARLGFWALLLAWLAIIAFAVVDAYQGARDANRANRPFEV